jgi:hypothetical protein
MNIILFISFLAQAYIETNKNRGKFVHKISASPVLNLQPEAYIMPFLKLKFY